MFVKEVEDTRVSCAGQIVRVREVSSSFEKAHRIAVPSAVIAQESVALFFFVKGHRIVAGLAQEDSCVLATNASPSEPLIQGLFL